MPKEPRAIRVAILAATLALAPTTASLAQDFTTEQRAACKGDYNKFCRGTMPGGGRVLACLNKVRAQLSNPCKNVVDAQNQ